MTRAKAPSRVEQTFLLQLRVELLGVDPPIWRRLLVPSTYSFWDLHVAIQDAMGWTDSHLHRFRFLGSDIALGIPDEDWGDDTEPGGDIPVVDLLYPGAPLALYEYDFGDAWQHELRLEHTRPIERGAHYPQCVGGARRCPPENCGGPPGYAELLAAVADPTHPEHASFVAWVGDAFDPEDFNPERVVFQDPATRWREVFENGDG